MTRLIAICGVDGSGKSTLCRALSQLNAPPEAVYLAKSYRNSTELVARYGFDSSDPRRNWAGGTFAQCAAIATTFDFLYHYDQVILPALAMHQHVVCDRYKQCYEAYCAAVDVQWPLQSLFGRVRHADLVLYLDLPPDAAAARYAERGGASEDENLETIKRFSASYRRLFARYTDCPVVRIDATLPPHDVQHVALGAIEKYVQQPW